MSNYRIEKDSMGEVRVPSDALYGAQTQRAVNNFNISGRPMPRAFIRALGLVKQACAQANQRLGLLDQARTDAIHKAAGEVAEGRHDAHFPVDVFQTGSGTSSNMNSNEVIAHLASQASGLDVHPNDHVNMSQSSNDVIPTSIHVSACLEIEERLKPALQHFAATVERKAGEISACVKTGRTHLMDAMPVRMEQELGAWAAQLRYGTARLDAALPRLKELAQGGTAVGSGVNCPDGFAQQFVTALNQLTGQDFSTKPDKFEALAAQDAAVEMSGQLKTIAASITKIANDLRWMNSGPLAGLAEIALPALQPGSSIMPGKVNPVIPEAAAMACAQVAGNDTAIYIAGQSGSFQLNVMLPLVAHNLLQSIGLLAGAAHSLADHAIADFQVNEQNLKRALDRNPILVTALNRVIGYEKGAKIAKRAYAEGRSVLDVACEETDLTEDQLRELLDPEQLTRGGVPEPSMQVQKQ